MPSPMHTTANGTRLPISKMTDSHLVNTIRQQRRRAKEGVECWYGGGSDADDMWMDVWYAYDEEALDAMHHDRYLREAKKRKLNVN